MKIKKILFPVDLSESSERIVEIVKEFTDKFQAELHLLFVARVFGYYSTIYVNADMISNLEIDVVRGGRKKMAEFQKEYFESTPGLTIRVTPGYPSEEILMYTSDNDIDMIIMGTHGRKGLEKVFFGSVAEQVVKTSPVPVLVVNPYKTKKTDQL